VLSDWWNGVELWMLGLPFPLQFALVVVVLAPVCLVVAWLIDRIVDHVSALFGPETPERPIDSLPHAEDAETEPDAELDADVEAEADVDAEADVEADVDADETRVPAESAGR
jgi:hypothetical protein